MESSKNSPISSVFTESELRANMNSCYREERGEDVKDKIICNKLFNSSAIDELGEGAWKDGGSTSTSTPHARDGGGRWSELFRV